MEQVNVGVIGTGALGRHHARLYGETPVANLVGIYDADPGAAAKVADEVGVRAFDDLGDLVAASDGLSLAVPTDLHYNMARELLLQEKHLLIEKPITQTVAQARELVDLAAERKLVLQVGHVERFNPVLECLDRAPGRPLFIEAHRLASYPPPRPGRRPRGTEVSVVLDLMIHDIDILLSLVGSSVASLDAVGVPVLSDSEDIANAHIEFDSGCIANLTASRVSRETMRKIRVFKPTGYLSLDYGAHKGLLVSKSDDSIEWSEVPVHEQNALLAELEDFCHCIADSRDAVTPTEPRVSGEQGLQALVLAERVLDDIHSRIEKVKQDEHLAPLEGAALRAPSL